MSSTSPITFDLADLRRLLRDSERDVAALSREEAERILHIADPRARMKAYLTLRENWGRGGDRLLPEDEARILASLANLATEAAPMPRPPVAGMPLTPMSLLAWAARWRPMLVESALQRGTVNRQPLSAAGFEALVAATDEPAEAERFPEIPVLRLLDALTRELQEGLETRLLLRDEALSGHVGNLAGLLRAVVSAKTQRLIVVPPAPAVPPLRSSIADILSWLEALLAFEEAVGARALLQAGVAVEPADAAARFRAAARQGGEDVLGHAAAQLASWRRADRAHRAAAAAQRAGWLGRDRMVVLPSFDIDELESWFAAFEVSPLPPPPPAPAMATPAAVQLYWTERRRQTLRRVALNLLAEGAVTDLSNADRHAMALVGSGGGAFAAEGREVQQADRVIALCHRLLLRGAAAEPVRDAADAELVLATWAAADSQVRSRQTPVMPMALPDPPAAPVRDPPPPPPSSDLVTTRSDDAPVFESPTAVPAASLWQRSAEAVSGISLVNATGLVVVLGCVIYQGAMVARAAIDGGLAGAASETVLRTALLTDPMWFLSGALPLLALVLLLPDLRRSPGLLRGRGWRAATLLRMLLAAGVLAGSTAFAPPLRFVFTDAGLPAWPERVVERGGVPTSILNPAEGTWLARRVVEPMRVDDLPAVAAGQPPLVLLREVGLFGGLRSWWLANAPDAEVLAGRPVTSFANAPSAVERKNPAP
ncbi:hypothetical protein [Falsiroseomonas sp.]|uniref:hypothetical protein n=1 Tax=Falsiroseomonas sp. TaxID=2870721 RepID=UPI0027240382|nr:hypothetical protein [Falsiroseomonas sp.]MDO9499038.1 hypothetical protein [Falsiroseomonas sp.]